MSNHRKYLNRKNSLLVYWHFKQTGHNFKQQAKFALIEQLDNTIVDFFTIWLLSLHIDGSQKCKGRGEPIVTPLCYLHPLRKHSDICHTITATLQTNGFNRELNFSNK